MQKTPRLLNARRLTALVALAFLASCSGSGCGNCTVPAFNATPLPGTTPTPGLTPTPSPGVTPTPSPGLTPTPSPAPTPTPAALSCSQGGPLTIPLNAAAHFVLLAGSTVTNVGNTIVTGTAGNDLVGVFPGSSVTGFPPGVLIPGGTADIYSGGAVPQTAQGAMTVAYGAAAAAAPTATFLGGQDLSQASSGIANCGPSGNAACGVGVLGSGVYKSPSSLFITAGNLTLDGGGNAQSVFIFQMVSSLNTGQVGGQGNVILINGASACNIYWQVGSSAVIGQTGGAALTFYGNVLANQSVAIYATTFTGRALASIGAVTVPVTLGSLITNPGGN